MNLFRPRLFPFYGENFFKHAQKKNLFVNHTITKSSSTRIFLWSKLFFYWNSLCFKKKGDFLASCELEIRKVFDGLIFWDGLEIWGGLKKDSRCGLFSLKIVIRFSNKNFNHVKSMRIWKNPKGRDVSFLQLKTFFAD